MRKNKLIINRKAGKWVYYSLNKENINELRKILAEIITTKEAISTH